MDFNKLKIVSEFNEAFETVVCEIADIRPNSPLAMNLNIIKSIIGEDNTKHYIDDYNNYKNARPNTLIIDYFVLYVLEFKDKIDAGDESFFLNNNTFNEKVNEINKTNFDVIGVIKNEWSELNNENRQIVFDFLRYLCNLALDYFSINNV